MTTITDKQYGHTSMDQRRRDQLSSMTSSTVFTPLSTSGASGANTVDINEDAIDTLNDLLEVCRDGEYGFRECAAHTKASDLKAVLDQRADDCRLAGNDLMTLIRQLGGECEEGGTAMGAIHRGWVAAKGSIAGYSDLDMLNECERGEDVALAHYRKALVRNLPEAAHALVKQQASGVQRNHDQIKALRDALKSAN